MKDMRKLMLIFAACVCGMFGVSAQDLIVKIDATQIKSKVLEIAPDAVKFKKFSNLEGPVYILPVSEIDYIVFANGEKEQFRRADRPAPVEAPAPAPASAPETPGVNLSDRVPAQTHGEIPEGYVRKRFEVGEYYDRNGVRGVVCDVTPDGLHGLVISMNEVTVTWCAKSLAEVSRRIGLDDKHDGEANWAKLMEYVEKNKLDLRNFPPYAWCRSLGEGWYLPSINELLTIAVNFNGGNRAVFNRNARNKFNDALHEHGGDKMDRLMYYFSSTEADDAREVLSSHMSPEPPFIVSVGKAQKWLARAVHRF